MPPAPRCDRCHAILEEDELFPDTLTPCLHLRGSRVVTIRGTEVGETIVRCLCRVCFSHLLGLIDEDPLAPRHGRA